jgi:transcriptional regulator with XRE-family HTH domain
VTSIICAESFDDVSLSAMGNEPWQARLKRAGYTQKELAAMMGMSQNAVTSQLSGKIDGRPDRYIKAIIIALGMLTTEQKEKLEAELGD